MDLIDKPRRAGLLILVIALLGSSSGPAAAQSARIKVVPQVDRRKDLPPDLEVRVITDSSAPLADKISLIQTDPKKGPVEIKAAGLRTYRQGDETLGVVVVVEAHEIWIGHDSYTESEPDKYPGVYQQLVPALDGLREAGPPGSKGAIITYSLGFTIRQPASDLSSLTGDMIGTQKSLGGKPNRDLANAVTEALAQVNKMGTSRKVVVVIGDGVDGNQTEASLALQEADQERPAAQRRGRLVDVDRQGGRRDRRPLLRPVSRR